MISTRETVVMLILTVLIGVFVVLAAYTAGTFGVWAGAGVAMLGLGLAYVIGWGAR